MNPVTPAARTNPPTPRTNPAEVAPHLQALVERAGHDRVHLVHLAQRAHETWEALRVARRAVRSTAQGLRWLVLAGSALALLRCLREGRRPSAIVILALGAQVLSLQAPVRTSPRIAPPPLR